MACGFSPIYTFCPEISCLLLNFPSVTIVPGYISVSVTKSFAFINTRFKMHCSKVAAFAVALAAPLIQAQAISLWNLPACAVSLRLTVLEFGTRSDGYSQQSAATSGLASTGCDLTDIACVCSAVSFVTKLSSAVQQSCSIADQQGILSTFLSG